MKKILSLLLATALFLVACGNKNETNGAAGSQNGTAKKLKN